jgi:NAD(P)-dependent dehydrogenase (short-subunit alcohol dehydrogenase family)
MTALDGKAALITGGGTGIGFGCAQRLIAQGATVTICGRRADVLADSVARLGDRAHFVVCDVTDDAQVLAAVQAAAEPLGRLDMVVAYAGGSSAVGPLVLTAPDAWQQTMAVNLTGTMSVIRHAAPFLSAAGGGSIVAVSSIAGHLTHRHLSAYAVAKAGIEMLVKSAADELGAWNIRVNAVRPGLVPTDISTALNESEATRADYIHQMPLGRVGTIDDVAALVEFLLGPTSTWITGQLIGVDGGHSLRRGPDIGLLVGPLFEDPLTKLLGPRYGS